MGGRLREVRLYYANKFSTLTPIKSLGLIVHGLCFLGVNVFLIEYTYTYIFGLQLKEKKNKQVTSNKAKEATTNQKTNETLNV